MKKLQLILLLLFPILFYSQNDYRDTIIEALINKKVNEYRVENGIYELIPTERFRSEIDPYAILAAEKIEKYLLLEHSEDQPRQEVICYVPCSEYWKDSKESAYNTMFSADSIAELTIGAWKNSPAHNSGLLDDIDNLQIITSVYVFYIDAREGWSAFVVTQIPTESDDGSIVLKFGY